MTAIAESPTAATVAELDWRAIASAGMHQTALSILELLAIVDGQDEPERTPKDFADTLEVALGVVSYHVRMLHGRGLIKLVRTEPRRGALQHFYRLTDTARAEAE